MLNFEIFGEKNVGGTLVIAHGLLGSLKNWRTIAKYFASTNRKVVIADMRNHGQSFWSDTHSYEELSEDLRILIKKFDDRADLIGHSMGGKAAMVLALRCFNSIRKMIVVDISPVNYDHDQTEYISVMQSIDLSAISNRVDLDKKLACKIPNRLTRAFLSQSADFTDRNSVKWLVNLASLRNNLSEIMKFPNIKSRNDLSCLFIRGEFSNYISDEHLKFIEQYFPNFCLRTIRQAGHWVQVDQREQFCRLVKIFLED